jgi:hypothetical protein
MVPGSTEYLVRRLAPALAHRFGADFPRVGLYPIPILTRDTPGYRITPHTDTQWEGITVQFYLPRDVLTTHIGTIFGRGPMSGRSYYAKGDVFTPRGRSCLDAAPTAGSPMRQGMEEMASEQAPWKRLKAAGKSMVSA